MMDLIGIIHTFIFSNPDMDHLTWNMSNNGHLEPSKWQQYDLETSLFVNLAYMTHAVGK